MIINPHWKHNFRRNVPQNNTGTRQIMPMAIRSPLARMQKLNRMPYKVQMMLSEYMLLMNASLTLISPPMQAGTHG
jgi:spore coat protein CotF